MIDTTRRGNREAMARTATAINVVMASSTMAETATEVEW